MGVKVDYVNKIDTSAINPVNPDEGIDVVYLTGAGYIDYPFRGISRDSALGWEEAVWGGNLTRSSKGFVMTNIADVDYGLVARLEFNYKYMNVSEYQVLMEISKQRVCYATYFNRETGKWIERQEMAFTGNELGKLYAFGVDYIGTMDIKIKLVATNRDKASKTCTIKFDKNINVDTITGSIKDYTVNWSDNTSYKKALEKAGNSEFKDTSGVFDVECFSTKPDGEGKNYSLTQDITVFDDLTLYAQWTLFFDNDWKTQYTEMGGIAENINRINFSMRPLKNYTELFGVLKSGIKIYRKSNGNEKYNLLFVSKPGVKICFPVDEKLLYAAYYGLFQGLLGLTNIYLSNTNIDTSKMTNMTFMFYQCLALTSLDVSNFDTSNVTSMAQMFANCSALTTLDLSSFDTSNVTSMAQMFANCSALTTLDLSSFDTSNVTNMSAMFYNCSALTTLDVSSFNTSQVTNMSSIFINCKSLTTLDLSNFDTSNVTYMPGMFAGCSALTTLDLSSFDFTKVTSYSSMFNSVPSDCLIYVKDETAKAWIESRFTNLTNVQIKE